MNKVESLIDHLHAMNSLLNKCHNEALNFNDSKLNEKLLKVESNIKEAIHYLSMRSESGVVLNSQPFKFQIKV